LKRYRGPPLTVGVAAAAQVRLTVSCKACQHQVEPDPVEMAAQYGADTSVLDCRGEACLFPLRRTAGRYGGDRNEAVIGEKSSEEIAEKSDGKRDGDPERPDF
jgi:hypothetical protein